MMKISELFINDDGKLSRTQVNMWLCHLTCLGLIVLEAIFSGIVTTPLIVVMALYTLSSHADRMDTRRMQIKLGRHGAEIAMQGDCGHQARQGVGT